MRVTHRIVIIKREFYGEATLFRHLHGKHFARIRTMLGRHRLISTQTHRALG